MHSNVVKGRVQSKSDTTANWNKAKNFVPLKGEICIYVDYYGENTPAIKVGDGKTRIQDLNFLGFEAHYETDGKSISIENGLSINNYSDALQGQMPTKDETEGIVWVNPVDDSELQQAVQDSKEYANQASNAAIISGNYAADALIAKEVVENKFWYGTMEEYNNLETVSRSTIYIILHE